MMDALIHRYAGLPVPRYTSYPTALEFSAAVGPPEKARWLETLDPAAPVSLYVHVPYCRDICHYCGCTTKMVIRDHVLANYRRLLEAEIARAASASTGWVIDPKSLAFLLPSPLSRDVCHEVCAGGATL